MFFELFSALVIMYAFYCITKDLIKALSNPKKFMRENRDIKKKHIDFID